MGKKAVDRLVTIAPLNKNELRHMRNKVLSMNEGVSRINRPLVGAALVVLYREIGMHVLRRYAALRGIVLAAKFSGKAKMVIQSIALILLLILIVAADSGWININLQTCTINKFHFCPSLLCKSALG